MKRTLRLVEGARSTHRALDDEIALHIDLRTAQLVAGGATPEAARAEAQRRFGGSVEGFEHATRELHQSASHRQGRMRFHEYVAATWQDAVYAARAMRRSPGFTLAATLTLALCVGANTAMFGVVNASLLRPLPYAHADRVVMVWNHWTNWPKTWLSGPEAVDYSQQRDVFASLSPYVTDATNLTGRGEPERVRTGYIPANFLATVGVHPLLGRAFSEAEDLPGGPRVALLDYGLWQRRFSGDPSIVGKTIEVSGSSRTVVGVLPPDFRLPTEFVGDRSQLYLPLALGPQSPDQRGSHYLLAVARLPDGVSKATADARLNTFITSYKKVDPDTYGPAFGTTLVPVEEEVFGGARRVLLFLFGAVGFVLLIGCANVANLLVSRAEGRQREISIRAALGAGRHRLARQLLTESVLLGLLGCAVAVPLAMFGGPLLVRLGSATLPRADATTFDARTLAFALTIAIVTSLVFGLAPVVHALRGDLQRSLRVARGAVAHGGLTIRHVIITLQVALAVVSVAGAALMMKSFARLTSVAPGFVPSDALTMRVSLPQKRYTTSSSMQRFYVDLMQRVQALPGVKAAGAVNMLPLASQLGDWAVQIEGRPRRKPGQVGPAFDWQIATPGYFQAMGIPLERGRTFTGADVHGAPPVVVISEMTARTWWPSQDPIGARILLGGPDSVWREVIGIVADVRHQALDKELRSEMYIPHAQFPTTLADSAAGAANSMVVVVRTARDPSRVAGAVRGAVHAMDPELPVAEVRTLDDVMSRSVATPRLAAILLGAFGVVALVLSAIGVYGVMSYAVARRTNEIGIRMALGAEASEVTRLVVQQAMVPALIGLGLGMAAALAGARLMRGLLYGVSETDPASLVLAIVVLGGVALIANVIPARRVARVDPVLALRGD